MVTAENIGMLQDAVRSVLRDGKSLANVTLYDDKKFFYIRTSNKISLNHFLFQNGFEELDEEKTSEDLNLLFGAA